MFILFLIFVFPFIFMLSFVFNSAILTLPSSLYVLSNAVLFLSFSLSIPGRGPMLLSTRLVRVGGSVCARLSVCLSLPLSSSFSLFLSRSVCVCSPTRLSWPWLGLVSLFWWGFVVSGFFWALFGQRVLRG